MASHRGYDAVVDVDEEGDLGHTDLHEDLEFHASTFEDAPRSKIPSEQRFAPDSALGSKRFLWSLSFYAQFFDVDTSDVLQRCGAALYPRRPFLDVLDGNADLYGPFWIATTVVFILFLTGTIAQYMAEHGHGTFAGYQIRLLSGACGLVYGYTAVVPVALWAVLRWFGSEAAQLLECVALYGYGNLIWIPVALFAWSPWTWLRWLFVAIGFAVSALFLARNLWPVVSAADQKVSRILVIVVVLLHAGYAIAILELFFAPVARVGDEPPAGDATPPADDAAALLLRLLRR